MSATLIGAISKGFFRIRRVILLCLLFHRSEFPLQVRILATELGVCVGGQVVLLSQFRVGYLQSFVLGCCLLYFLFYAFDFIGVLLYQLTRGFPNV